MNNKLTRMVWGAVAAVAGLMGTPATVEASQTFNFSPTPINLQFSPVCPAVKAERRICFSQTLVYIYLPHGPPEIA